MTNSEIQALIDQGVAQLKLTTKGYSGHPPEWYTNPTTAWYKGLALLEQARAALDVVPPPTPLPSETIHPYGVLRLGPSYATASGYDRYGQVGATVSDVDKLGALPATTKSIVYMDYLESPTWFAGMPQSQAGPYTLAIEIEPYAGLPLLDPTVPGLAEALVKNIGDFLRLHSLDGFYSDNIQASLAAFPLASRPSKFPTEISWYTAVQALVINVGQALKAQGFYVGANMISYFPGNAGVFPGTNSDNGTASAQWIKMCAPGLSWAMVENWMWANGHLRGVTSTLSWDNQWDQWQSLVRSTQDLGLDFVATINVDQSGQGAAVFTQASFLLDKDDNRAGGVMVMGGTEPFSTTWAKPVGKALGAKVKSGNVWTRRFDNGAGGVVAVTVDPVAKTASIV